MPPPPSTLPSVAASTCDKMLRSRKTGERNVPNYLLVSYPTAAPVNCPAGMPTLAYRVCTLPYGMWDVCCRELRPHTNTVLPTVQHSCIGSFPNPWDGPSTSSAGVVELRYLTLAGPLTEVSDGGKIRVHYSWISSPRTYVITRYLGFKGGWKVGFAAYRSSVLST